MRHKSKALKSTLGGVRAFDPPFPSLKNKRVDSWCTEKYLLALKCLLAAAKLAPENSTVHGQIIRFKKTIDSLSEPPPTEVTTVIDSELYPTLLPAKDSDLVAFNDSYLTKHQNTPAELVGALRAKYFLDPKSTTEIETSMLQSITGELELFTLQDVCDGLTLLRDVKASDETVEQYKSTAKGRWENVDVLA